MNAVHRLALALIVLLAAAPASAAMYKWVDSQGRVHFSDKPPPGAKARAERLNVRGAEPAPAAEARPATAGLPAVTLYSADCGPTCEQARALLDRRGIACTYRDVQADRAAADAMQKLTGSLEVPVLTIGGNVHKGFQTQLWNNLLDAAGYNRPAPSAPSAPAQATP